MELRMYICWTNEIEKWQVLFINLHGKGLSPRASMGDGARGGGDSNMEQTGSFLWPLKETNLGVA